MAREKKYPGHDLSTVVEMVPSILERHGVGMSAKELLEAANARPGIRPSDLGRELAKHAEHLGVEVNGGRTRRGRLYFLAGHLHHSDTIPAFGAAPVVAPELTLKDIMSSVSDDIREHVDCLRWALVEGDMSAASRRVGQVNLLMQVHGILTQAHDLLWSHR